MQAVLIATYELGRQPFGLASPAAWLREAGIDVRCVDVSREPLDDAVVRDADLVAWHLPMHTATRLAVPLIAKVREVNPAAHLCCFGLYAPLNESYLRTLGVQSVLGPEFEADLAGLASALGRPREASRRSDQRSEAPSERLPVVPVPRLRFRVPDRRGLPGLERYARLRLAPEVHRLTGYTEASRGCKHHCRHCPIVPVYGGRFRVVPVDVVLEDVRQQVAAGAEHITFGDPDFFNGVRHARRVVEGVSREFPDLTYDVTIKVEHLVRHHQELAVLKATGCLFVTSAVEAFDDAVLAKLAKGHTRAQVTRAVELCRQADLTLVPTFVAFTPWTTLEGYCEMLQAIETLDLVEAVAPVQLGIRLLIPARSKLLDLAEVQSMLEPFDAERLVYPWRHADPRVDRLQEDVSALVARQGGRSRLEVFGDVSRLARRGAGLAEAPAASQPVLRSRAAVPYLTEPWYC